MENTTDTFQIITNKSLCKQHFVKKKNELELEFFESDLVKIRAVSNILDKFG